MLSEQLTEDVLRNTHINTKDIVEVFTDELNQGIEGMNLKLVIDLLEDVAHYDKGERK